MANRHPIGRRRSVWYRQSHRQWYTTVNGTQHPLGVTDPAAEQAALAALRKLLKTLETPEKTPELGTVAEAVANYLAGPGSRSAATHRAALHYCSRLVARFGTEQVAGLSVPTVEGWASTQPGLSPDSVRNLLMVAEAVLKCAGRTVSFVKPPRGSRGTEAVIPEAIYQRAVGAARGDLRALIQSLWETGARPSELRKLADNNVDWQAGVASLLAHKTARKTGRKRIIPLSKEALKVLAGQRERHGAGLLFRTLNGTAYTMPGLTQAMWRIAKRVDHPGLTAYGFRHTWATRALAAGVPDTHVAAVLGHTSTAMIHKHYSHLNQDAKLLRDVVDRVSRPKGRKG